MESPEPWTLNPVHPCAQGLEDQLLGEVVRRERPDLEEQRDSLVLSISADKKQLAELEDKVRRRAGRPCMRVHSLLSNFGILASALSASRSALPPQPSPNLRHKP